jgi:hypothetical protein
MNTTNPMYADLARTEIVQRLREADDERRRRLARPRRVPENPAQAPIGSNPSARRDGRW